jgi:hypothetical protein
MSRMTVCANGRGGLLYLMYIGMPRVGAVFRAVVLT